MRFLGAPGTLKFAVAGMIWGYFIRNDFHILYLTVYVFAWEPSCFRATAHRGSSEINLGKSWLDGKESKIEPTGLNSPRRGRRTRQGDDMSSH